MQQGKERPHRPLEVESGSSQHHVDVVPEHPGIEVATEPVVRLEVPDDRLYPRPLAEELVFLASHVVGVAGLRHIGYPDWQ